MTQAEGERNEPLQRSRAGLARQHDANHDQGAVSSVTLPEVVGKYPRAQKRGRSMIVTINNNPNLEGTGIPHRSGPWGANYPQGGRGREGPKGLTGWARERVDCKVRETINEMGTGKPGTGRSA